MNKWGCRNPNYQIKMKVRVRISLNYVKKICKRVGEGGVGDKSIWYLDYLCMYSSKSIGSKMK